MAKVKCLTETDLMIYELIPQEGSISRLELVQATGLKDRTVRRSIERLSRNPETMVISHPKRNGYKRPSSTDELKEYLRQSEKKVRLEQERQTAIRRAISAMKKREDRSGQKYLDFWKKTGGR